MPQPLTAEMDKRDHEPGFFWEKREGLQTGYIVKELVWGRDSRASLKSRLLGAFILSVPGQKEDLQVVEMVWNLTESDPVPLGWLCWGYHHQEMLGTNWKPLW